jgi:DNA sulfur modification protein DndD
MRLFDLQLKNIGPFEEASLTFIDAKNDQKRPPVIIITGENGTGKTIILDAIRAVLLGRWGDINRDIVREQSDFHRQLDLYF